MVTFATIPGHGRADALAMQTVDVTRVVDTADGLVAALRDFGEASVEWRARIRRGRALFVGDAADAVLTTAHTSTDEPA